MQNEFTDLLETAIYKEIASEALYAAMKDRTADPGARELMAALAAEEKRHARWLTELRDNGRNRRWREDVIRDLKISEHIAGGESLEGAGLQDALIFAMKKEQYAIDFYSRMTRALRTEAARKLCKRLVTQELGHKLKLEIMYDQMFLGEN